MAANHNHALDPVFIGIPIENRQMHFMAKKELFKMDKKIDKLLENHQNLDDRLTRVEELSTTQETLLFQ